MFAFVGENTPGVYSSQALFDASGKITEPGTGDPIADIADIEEVVRVGIASIAHEKCIGAEEDRSIGVIGKLGDDLVVERRGIEEGSDARKHRQERAAGQAESMEHRERIEHDVLGGEIDARRRLKTIGLEIAM